MSKQVITQEQLNEIMGQMPGGGCARLILAIISISTKWPSLVAGTPTVLIVLLGFRQLSELDNIQANQVNDLLFVCI